MEENFKHLLTSSGQTQQEIEDVTDFDAQSHSVTIRDNDSEKVTDPYIYNP